MRSKSATKIVQCTDENGSVDTTDGNSNSGADDSSNNSIVNKPAFRTTSNSVTKTVKGMGQNAPVDTPTQEINPSNVNKKVDDVLSDNPMSPALLSLQEQYGSDASTDTE
jgi:hypothetical protein